MARVARRRLRYPVGAVLSLLSYLLIMRRLRGAVESSRVVAGLGILLVLQSGAVIRYGSVPVQVNRFIFVDSYQVAGATFNEDAIVVVFLTIVLGIALTLMFRRPGGLVGTGVTRATDSRSGGGNFTRSLRHRCVAPGRGLGGHERDLAVADDGSLALATHLDRVPGFRRRPIGTLPQLWAYNNCGPSHRHIRLRACGFQPTNHHRRCRAIRHHCHRSFRWRKHRPRPWDDRHPTTESGQWSSSFEDCRRPFGAYFAYDRSLHR